jgi:hypothetical protein
LFVIAIKIELKIYCSVKLLKSTEQAKQFFNVIDTFMMEHNINRQKCVDVSTAGARAMVRKVVGVVACIKALVLSSWSSHCLLHQQGLVVKTMPANLKNVPHDTVKFVSHIKAKPTNARIFRILCEEMFSEHTSLLLHTELRWLPRGKVLVWVFELCTEFLHSLWIIYFITSFIMIYMAAEAGILSRHFHEGQ